MVPVGSRAVLIGAAEFEDTRFPAIPAALNSVEAMRRILTRPDLGGWADDQVTVVRNPSNAGRLAQGLRQLMRETTGVLLLYYVGHGQLTPEGQLCLTVKDTDADSPDFLGLRYEWLASALRESPALVKITILDCCYSGQAIEALSASDVADTTYVAGVYTLTATARNEAAHVVPLAEQDEALTSFTDQLVRLVEEGIPGGPAVLTLGDIYRSLQYRLAARGLPRPKQRGTDSAVDFVFAKNVGVGVADAERVVEPVVDGRQGPFDAAPLAQESLEGPAEEAHPGGDGFELPAGLGRRFRVAAVLSVGTGDADVLEVLDSATGARQLLRLYRRGIVLDSDAAEGLRMLSRTAEGSRHLVQLEAVGVDDRRYYELQEHPHHGSLRSVMDSGRRLDAPAVARQLGQAVAFLEGKLRPGGLRPDDLLVRSLHPLDVVVGDLRIHPGQPADATVVYLPPEAGRGLPPTPAWDWWSVGMVVAEVAIGRHPLTERNGRFPSHRETFDRIHYGTIDLTPIRDHRVSMLCTGLLRRDPAQRWGRKHVLAWIAGVPPSAR